MKEINLARFNLKQVLIRKLKLYRIIKKRNKYFDRNRKH